MEYEMTYRVQYYETDTMGIVHHSNYIRYFETVRTEFIRAAGLPYDKIEEMGVSTKRKQLRKSVESGESCFRMQVRVPNAQ